MMREGSFKPATAITESVSSFGVIGFLRNKSTPRCSISLTIDAPSFSYITMVLVYGFDVMMSLHVAMLSPNAEQSNTVMSSFLPKSFEADLPTLVTILTPNPACSRADLYFAAIPASLSTMRIVRPLEAPLRDQGKEEIKVNLKNGQSAYLSSEYDSQN